MKNIIETLNERTLVFDGAMGTTIYSRGVFINTCFDELNLSRPDLIKEIHQEYVDAGADVILTNTFGANSIKLKKYGLGGKCKEINEAGVKLAKEIAGDKVYVLGSVGSRLKLGSIMTSENQQEIEDSYHEQISALVKAGVDGIMLETYFDLKELLLGAKIAKSYNIPVIASMTSRKELETPEGLDIAKALQKLDKCSDIDALGLNCTIGPHAMLSAVKKVIDKIHKPLIIRPNAGNPKKLEGRTIYMNTPEYFTTYCKHYIELGVKGVGGCCGTDHKHIEDMAKAVKAITSTKKKIEIIKSDNTELAEINVTPTIEKSNFAKKLFSKEHATTIEITPPRSTDLTDVLKKVEQCKEAGIDAINIPDGPRASSRISPLVTALMIEQKTGMETILHYCCRDRNLIGMQSDLLGGYAGGLKNYLIVTGDPPKLGNYPDATAVFDVDAVGLTTVVNNLNHGLDIAGNTINPPTSILIGVGANPCALDIEKEINHFHNKVKAGAEFVITQPVFDTDSLIKFIDKIRNLDIDIPLVAGIWPLVSYRNAMFLKTEVPGVVVPDSIIERMSKATTKEDGIKIGLEIAIEMKNKIAPYVAGYQVSAPFGKVECAVEVLK